MSSESPSIDPAIYRACEAVGGIVEMWGFKRVLGMVWTFVYLSPRPLSAQEIRSGLGISSGLVSMVLQELVRWGVVHKQPTPGERKEYYTAERNVWRPISKVIREREMYQVSTTLERLREAEIELEAAGDEDEDECKRVAADRLAELIQVGELAHSMLDQFVSLGVLDARDLRSVALGVGLTRTMFQMKRLAEKQRRGEME
ncbi:MAG TPA: MarR family transcriptional regulator [Pantanalinema sp.]